MVAGSERGGGVALWRQGRVVVRGGWRRGRPRSGPCRPHLGPNWLTLDAASSMRGEEEQLGRETVTPTACLLQRDGESFMGCEIPARPMGPRAWYAPAIASGRRSSLAVEVDPSHMPTVLLSLVPGPFRRCAGLTLQCRGETAWGLQDCVDAG